jgi:hypothetical protein
VIANNPPVNIHNFLLSGAVASEQSLLVVCWVPNTK